MRGSPLLERVDRAGLLLAIAAVDCAMRTRGRDGRFACHSNRHDCATRTPMAGVQRSVIAIAAS